MPFNPFNSYSSSNQDSDTNTASPKPFKIRPEQAIQYYRASSVVLTLDAYNDTALFISNASSSPEDGDADHAPLPKWVDRYLLDCVNQTIGLAVPLTKGPKDLRLGDKIFLGLYALLGFSFFLFPVFLLLKRKLFPSEVQVAEDGEEGEEEEEETVEDDSRIQRSDSDSTVDSMEEGSYYCKPTGTNRHVDKDSQRAETKVKAKAKVKEVRWAGQTPDTGSLEKIKELDEDSAESQDSQDTGGKKPVGCHLDGLDGLERIKILFEDREELQQRRTPR